MTPSCPPHDAELDARELPCPLPLLKAKQALHGLASGQILQVRATDPGSLRDIPAWCRQLGHALLVSETLGREYRFLIRKK
jgi:tRNA 2-thiouridine synthesizing protein A